jgi:steroid delta-isomerase-like uncharacterized protein
MLTLHQIRRLWQKHVIAENRRNIPGMLATLCEDPTYILMATGAQFRGPDQVAAFYRSLFEAVPDATFELRNQYVGQEGVVEESVLKGTHTGQALFGYAARGGRIELPLTIVFPLEGERFWGERMYFDAGTLARQLGHDSGQKEGR